MRIVHIITSLETGGAEQALFELVRGMQGTRFETSVVGLGSDGAIAERIRALGVPVLVMGMAPTRPDLFALGKLVGWLQETTPALVQTWMYHADLLGGYASRAAGVPRLVWGIHHADLSPRNNKWTTLLVARLCARLSRRWPDRIISPSRAALQAHTRLGYASQKFIHIPNGFDLARFQPDPQTRAAVRKALGLAQDVPLIGMAARFHPLKDHVTFIEAARLLSREMPRVHYLLCGKGVDWQNPALVTRIGDAGLTGQFHLLGLRSDVPNIFNALDIGTLTSLSEAFPSVVGEMMASGLPCVVTDAGDAAEILGETGQVVPVGDAAAIADAWRDLFRKSLAERQALGAAARRRVLEEFSIRRMVSRYQALYLSLTTLEGEQNHKN